MAGIKLEKMWNKMMVTDPQSEIIKLLVEVLSIVLAVIILLVAITLNKNPKRKHRKLLNIISAILIVICLLATVFAFLK